MINIGVLGCANIADRMMIPAIIENENFKLIAVASRSENKAKALAKKYNCKAVIGYENLIDLDELDAIYIPLPTGLHFEWAKKAIEKGKHCIIEKSITESFDKTKELIELAKQKKVCVFENFMFQYHSQIETIKSLAIKHNLGDLRILRSSFGFPPFKSDNIRYQKDLGGGSLLDAGAYTLKVSQLFLKQPLKVTSSNLIFGETDVDIYGSATIINNSKETAQLAFGFDHYYQCNIEIWCKNGKLIADKIFTAGPGFKPTVRIEKQDERFEYQLDSDNHFIKSLNQFSAFIHKDIKTKNYDEIIAQAQLLDQVFKKCKIKYM